MNRKAVRKLVDEIKDIYDNPYARIHHEYLKKRKIPHVPYSRRYPPHVPYSRRYPQYLSIRRKNMAYNLGE